MKKKIKLVSLALIALTLVLMFLPIAKFEDHSADSLSEDIAKQEDKLQRAKDKYDRYVSGGKDADTLAKQQKQVDKEQGKLDELLAQQSAASGETVDALSYSLLPGKLPAPWSWTSRSSTTISSIRQTLTASTPASGARLSS